MWDHLVWKLYIDQRGSVPRDVAGLQDVGDIWMWEGRCMVGTVGMCGEGRCMVGTAGMCGEGI